MPEIFHSPNCYLAFKQNRGFQADNGLRNDNHAWQAFTLFEWLLGDAIESFAAEIFHAVFPNYFTLSRASVIHWRVSNTIAVCLMPTGEPSPVSVQLTIEQAKFLAANLMSPEHLVNERYPDQWPR
ncbi:MAG: hypothetical protein DMG58_37770 [Acidobacteria bacterium]|nr:MAG: hypothetical protein DMG58_37770 [Acidobacteriota bacterium]